MHRIVSWCLKNKSVVVLATLLLVGSGVYASTRLNQELFPDIAFPLITVTTPVPGAGPDLVDEQVTQTVESAVSGVEGIESIQATSSQGFSLVAVEFDLDADTEEAEADINDVLASLTLPQQAGEPEVRRQSAAEFPILNISLAAENGDLAALTTYARDEAIPRIEEVEGVGRVELVGGAEERIEVELDPEELKENNLPPEAVIGAISSAGVNAPVGAVQVDGLSTPVRVTGELKDAEALKDLPVGAGAAAAAAAGAPKGGASKGGGPGGGRPGGGLGGATKGAPGALSATPSSVEPVLLGDVADVREAGSEIAGISRTDGEPSLGLNVLKAPDTNTVEVARGVEEALDEIREDLGEDEVRIVLDSARDVEKSVRGLVQEGLIGALLAVLVIFAFLRSLRATLVTAVSLPSSVLAALLFSWGYDLTLNILTLAGLTIAVGRVVDDAIVVLENSYRYVQAGYEPEEAALKGTTEVASAITSSTLTTTAVFIPLAVVGGLISKFFVPLSLTVALALLASLIVSVTIIPVLVSVFIKRAKPREGPPSKHIPEKVLEGSSETTAEEYVAKIPETNPSDWSPRRASPWSSSRFERAESEAFDRPTAVKTPPDDLDREIERGPRSREPAALAAFLLVVGVVVAAGWTGLLGGFFNAVSGVFSRINFSSSAVLVTFGVLGGVFGTLLLVGLVALAVREARRPVRRGGGSEGSMVRLYTPMLRWSLRHRAVVLILAFLLFAGGVVTAFFLPVSFFPPSQENILIAEVELPAGTSLQRTSEELESFEDFLLDDPAIESYLLAVGGKNSLDFDPVRNNNQAQAFITVEEGEDVSGAVDRVKEEGARLYGEENFQVEIIAGGPPQGELRAVITGGSEEELRDASELVAREISENDEVINVKSDLSESTPEVAVVVDPERAARAGVSPAQVSSSLGILLGSGAQTSLGETPVSIGVPEEEVYSLQEVRGLPVGAGATVGNVADVREEEAPSAITRSDGERAVTVSGRITSDDTAAVSSEVEAVVAELDLPGDVMASVGGEAEDIEESFYDLYLSILVALALVYLILVVFFGSLLVPLIILLAVPLTTVGAFGTLFLTNTPLSLPSLLGLLLLIGIVVSNAILLVDFAIKARGDYESLDEAVVVAGQTRLRPILMTALATIFALLPLALGLAGGGSELVSSSLAITVIGGLLTSTLLTLLVVPVGYSLLERRRSKKEKYAG
ncbi:MAG TPA: efflux RND transporter permease subunit [Rubrobacteraceae bacterium]|nr:efflux RND transporter permease subunit [Rubrobacteraceae bacterium]